jgi:tetratricopeptide (TPR) repeat protein
VIPAVIKQQIKSFDAYNEKEVAALYIKLGEAYADLKNKKGSLDSLLRAVQLYKLPYIFPYKKLAEAYYYIAQHLYSLGHYHKAMQYCETALKWARDGLASHFKTTGIFWNLSRIAH